MEWMRLDEDRDRRELWQRPSKKVRSSFDVECIYGFVMLGGL